MIILGLDPSLSSTGICLINAGNGSIGESLAIQPASKGPERLAFFRQSIVNLLSMRTGIHAFIEGYAFGAMNQREALGELGGVLRLALYDAGIPMVIVQPTALKKFATGKGNADKILMGVSLMQEFGISYPTSDQTDAFWLCQFGRAYFGLFPDLSKFRGKVIYDSKNPKPKRRKVKKVE